MSYLVVEINLSPAQPWSEILLAVLSENQYDSFEETPEGLKAYIQKEAFDERFITDSIAGLGEAVESSWKTFALDDKNWNESWESNFQPIDVDGKLVVRAPFHDKTDLSEIVIQPQMSFGTGHHETTHLILSRLHSDDFTGKAVLDMGCGTGVLAICCELRGAISLVGIDIDEWSVGNTVDNMKLNGCTRLEVRHGGAEAIGSNRFDLVIANINRNILMRDMAHYVKTMLPGATLMLSGFYTGDCEMLITHCSELGLDHVRTYERHGWAMLELAI